MFKQISIVSNIISIVTVGYPTFDSWKAKVVIFNKILRSMYVHSTLRSKSIRLPSLRAAEGWLLRRCGFCNLHDEDFEGAMHIQKHYFHHFTHLSLFLLLKYSWNWVSSPKYFDSIRLDVPFILLLVPLNK